MSRIQSIGSVQPGTPDVVEALRDPDMSTNIHVHTLMVTVVLSSLSDARIHFPGVAESIRIDHGSRLLQAVQGFQVIGRFDLPAANEDEAHDMLPKRAARLERPLKTIEEISAFVYDTANEERISNSCTVVVFAIPVFCEAADIPLVDGLVPIWKWAKPKSVYPLKSGFWEADLSAALDHGEWNAGKDLCLLVRGALESEVTMIRESGSKFKTMPRRAES
jgi:hypothetical protein